MIGKKYYSISDLVEDGTYEIHPLGDDKVTGTIIVKDGVVYDNDLPMNKDLMCCIEQFEETNQVFYVKTK